MRQRRTPLRLLDFDVEARPLGWFGGDFTHKEVTVVAWCWWGGTPEAKALTKDDRTRVRMLKAWRKQYDQADMVVGHYIRSFDLPLMNAMLIETGEPGLGAKLTHDTKADLVAMHGLSKSQENLCSLFGIGEKVGMTVGDWRRANRLQDVDSGIVRAVGDVVQNMELRDFLVANGLLKPPKVWRPD